MKREPAKEDAPQPRPVRWVASSRADLRAMPEEVKDRVGYGLWRAQLGEKAESAKELKGFGGAGVLELVEDFDRATYRAVYTVRFAQAVYVLHVFQKKSKKGAKTPLPDKALIERRLRWAEEDVKARGEDT